MAKTNDKMTSEEYIRLHREEDVRQLALKGAPEGVDLTWCLTQIEGWQTARRKLPLWAATEGLHFPPRSSMEQCSSELTARYKRSIVERLMLGEYGAMADLTGGFGVDFSYLSPLFPQAFYVEHQAALCRTATHNFKLLGLDNAQVCCADSAQFLSDSSSFSFIFLDPARRATGGRKVVGMEDCIPSVPDLRPLLMEKAPWVMVKLSPMLDIASALHKLPSVVEVHVVSVEGECRELLLVVRRNAREGSPHYFTVHFQQGKCQEFTFSSEEKADHEVTYWQGGPSFPEGSTLFEPNASVMKASGQDALCRAYGLQKLHPFSHLMVGSQDLPAFPGRRFRIYGTAPCNRRGVSQLVGKERKANLTVRNFPSSVEALRRRWKLKEGGEQTLFATTLVDGSHVLIGGIRA